MKFNEVLASIESTEFAVQANLASGYRTFFRIVCEHESVNKLLQKLSKSLRQRHLVLARIRQLVKRNFDLEYGNPWDVALATYLHTLSLVDLDLAEEGAAIASEAPNCWWSTKITQHLLAYARFEEAKSSTGVSQCELKPGLKQPGFGQRTKNQTVQETRQTVSPVGQVVKSHAAVGRSRTVFATVYVKPSHSNFSVRAFSGSSEVFVTVR